jgi:hypothetical protein
MLFRYCTQEKACKIHTFTQSTTHPPSYTTDPRTYELLICKFPFNIFPDTLESFVKETHIHSTAITGLQCILQFLQPLSTKTHTCPNLTYAVSCKCNFQVHISNTLLPPPSSHTYCFVWCVLEIA